MNSLPNSWRAVHLGEIAAEVSERNADSTALPVLSVTKHSGFVPSLEYFTKQVFSRDTDNYKVVRRGQFAYATIHLDEGSIDLLETIDAGLISPMYTVFKLLTDEVDPKFLRYRLKSSDFIRLYGAIGEGSVVRRKSISFDTLAKLRIPLPPLPEQHRIVAVLGSVDDAIQSVLAVVGQTRRVKQGLLQELLTRGIGHMRFRKLGDWNVGRLLGVSEIPTTWELVQLTDVAKLESGHTPSRNRNEYWGGDVPWISLHDTKSLGSREIYNTAEYTTLLGIQNSSARLLPAGTVVFSRTASIGHCTIMGRSMATSQDFANYICGKRLHNRYLMHLFRWMQPEWKRLSSGSTHQTVYMPVFEQLQVLLPPIEEQIRIAEIADSIDYLLEQYSNDSRSLQAIKQGLMQDLLTGRVRVPTAA